ncbi:MAG TPA: VCBS repeat-containing protein [Bryobacteraceae bacterium]|nr:VCBS repeat-containing protein [Bryobacteraceae bacterium]
MKKTATFLLVSSGALVGVLAGVLLGATAGGSSGPVQFTTHVIEANIRGGYSVMVTDINHDGKLDIVPVGAGNPDLNWYENPGWQKHMIVNDKKSMLWASPADIDGDGIPEIALLSGFGQDPARSAGTISLLKSQGDPREPWKSYHVDAVPTAHRVTWADLEGNGKKDIVMAPFVGLKGWGNPKYQDNVPLYFWRIPKTLDGPYKRELIDDSFYGVIHHLHAVKWTSGKRDELLVAGFDGLVLETPSGRGSRLKFTRKVLAPGDSQRETKGAGLTKGANDLYMLNIKGKRFLAAEEPWHGDSIVVYSPEKGGGWQRHLIYQGFIQAHEMGVADLNGDGRDDIVVVDVTSRGRPSPTGVHIFYSKDDAGLQWDHEQIDAPQGAASGVAVADINGDGRPDIVAIGREVKYYENMGPAK